MKTQQLKAWIEKKHQELGPVAFWCVFIVLLTIGMNILNLILSFWLGMFRLMVKP